MALRDTKFQTVGARYLDFEVTKCVEITELQCHLCELVHLQTGSHVMHIANDDPENLFCLSFQTLPSSSNGVAHILEHTVLCGSKKFPIKDPFFAMTRRSLNTFMNALTGADFTCYPAATQVRKDFYNLLEVYLDAVFYPNLNALSFSQEGHRLEFAVPNDPTTPLEYKGIVFNEMKGAMASANARLHELVLSSLFPDLTYGYNSGGDPAVIPSLTYEELKDFHRFYYHPSRCLFFFYGNMPLSDHLDFIHKEILDKSERAPPLPLLPKQQRFSAPKNVMGSYPIGVEEDPKGKTLIAFSWLTCQIQKQEELLALSLLEVMLLDTDASPLKKALLKSGLCKQVSSYLDSDMSEAPFTITLRGCDPENANSLQDLIFTTFRQISEIGFPLPLIENALHQLEFHRSEITGDHGPYGLSLFMRSALFKQHGAVAEEGLKIHSLIETVRRNNLANPRYFNTIIDKYILDNPHAVTVVMQPDPHLGTQEIEAEKQGLKKLKEQLSEAQKNDLVKQAMNLAAFQAAQEEENSNILPRVTHEDVPRASRDFVLTQEAIDDFQVFHHTTFTNGIVYGDLVFDLPEIKEEDLPFVRLFAILLSQLGCGSRNYIDNLDYIQAHTGGIGASITFNLQARDSSVFNPSFYIRGKALYRKADRLLLLMNDMTHSADFKDLSRLREVIVKHFVTLQSSFLQNSLRYAVNLSAASLDYPSRIANAWYGLEYYHTIKEIYDHIDKKLPQVAEKLTALKDLLFSHPEPHLILTCDAAHYEALKQHRFYGITKRTPTSYKPWCCKHYSLPSICSQGKIIASPVAFIAKVLKTVPYAHPHAPALNIASFLCDNLVLHTKIREQGGAYGGGAISNPMASNFYVYSFRDPNVHSTLEAFQEAIFEILEGNFDEEDLEEAKLEMIQVLDAPTSPGSRGDLAYGRLREGKTYELRQTFRTRILEMTKENVIEAVREQILPQMHKGATIIFAGKELLEKENHILVQNGKSPLPLEDISANPKNHKKNGRI